MFRKITYSFVFCWTLFIAFALPGFASYESLLEEDWTFYNEQLITSATANGVKVDLPVEFPELTGNASGYGTFIKKIDVPESIDLAMLVPFMYSAAAIYVNGELLQEIGQLSTQAQGQENNLQSVVVPLPKGSSELEIAIQISSFEHMRGGFSNAPVVGNRELIYKQYTIERYNQMFSNGIIFLAGIMTVFIGLLRREEKQLFTFGLFALVIAVRGIFVVPFLYHDLPFKVSYEWATRLEYITTNVAFMLYAIFIYVLYKKMFSKNMLIFVVTILAILTMLSMFAPEVLYQRLFFNVFPFIGIFIIYNIWVMVQAVRQRMQLAVPLLAGIIFVFIGLIIDYLSGMGVISVLPTANFMIALNVILVIFAVCQNYVKQLQLVTTLNTTLEDVVQSRTEELEKANEELMRLVNTDALTGSYNRHKFNVEVERQFQRSITEQQPMGLIMIDVDAFKKYNDFYGHVHGDELLKQLVRILQRELPHDALLARYGGEEFAVIITNYTLDQIDSIGQRLVTAVEQAKLEHLGRDFSYATISAGCAERVADCVKSAEDLIRTADKRLYISKETGRNKVTSRS